MHASSEVLVNADLKVSDKLTGYEELIDVLVTLRVILRETRRRKAMSMRDAGDVLGVAASTVMRWERGETVGLGVEGIVKVLRWADS